jgi:hypothetical protein
LNFRHISKEDDLGYVSQLALVAVFAFGWVSYAGQAEVDGQIFYKKSNGEVVYRDVTITVPSRGQGEVALRGNGFEWKTTDFRSYMKKGRLVFVAVFQSEFRDKKSSIALKGTYLKGQNKIIYYGNMYKTKGHGADSSDLSSFRYMGGFNFEFDR